MARRKTWLPGWERKVRPVAPVRPTPEPGSPAVGHLRHEALIASDDIRRAGEILAAGGELPPRPKKQRPTGGGPLPVRGSSEQGAARRAAAVWSKVLGGLDYDAVAALQKQASAEGTALGLLLKGEDEANLILANLRMDAPEKEVIETQARAQAARGSVDPAAALRRLPPDVGAEIALALAAGLDEVRRARAAAVKASFELGLVKKLLRPVPGKSGSWLASGPPEMHAADLASYKAAAQWWEERRERRSLRGPLMVKGAPRPFPRNN